MKYIRKFEGRNPMTNQKVNGKFGLLMGTPIKKENSEPEKYFLYAYQNNNCTVPYEFTKIASEFYVYDKYYLYDNNIYKFNDRSMLGIKDEIKLCEFKPSDLIKDLEEELDKIEKAIEKLEYGHDV